MDWVFNVFQVIFLKSMLGTAESEPWNTKIRTFPYVSWPKWVSTFQQNVSWHQHWPSCNSSVKICKIPRSKSWNANPVTILNCRKTSWTSTYPHRPVAKWVAHVCHSSLSTQRWKTKPEQPQKGDGWLMGKWFSLKSSFLKEKINKLRHSSPTKHDLMFPSYSSYACWRTSVHIYIYIYIVIPTIFNHHEHQWRDCLYLCKLQSFSQHPWSVNIMYVDSIEYSEGMVAW